MHAVQRGLCEHAARAFCLHPLKATFRVFVPVEDRPTTSTYTAKRTLYTLYLLASSCMGSCMCARPRVHAQKCNARFTRPSRTHTNAHAGTCSPLRSGAATSTARPSASAARCSTCTRCMQRSLAGRARSGRRASRAWGGCSARKCASRVSASWSQPSRSVLRALHMDLCVCLCVCWCACVHVCVCVT